MLKSRQNQKRARGSYIRGAVLGEEAGKMSVTMGAICFGIIIGELLMSWMDGSAFDAEKVVTAALWLCVGVYFGWRDAMREAKGD